MTDDDDPVICLCAHVRESEIVAAARNGCHDLPSIRDRTSANTGCGDCAEDVEELLQYVTSL